MLQSCLLPRALAAERYIIEGCRTPHPRTAIDRLLSRGTSFVVFSAVRPNWTFSKWDIMEDPLPHPHPDFEPSTTRESRAKRVRSPVTSFVDFSALLSNHRCPAPPKVGGALNFNFQPRFLDIVDFFFGTTKILKFGCGKFNAPPPRNSMPPPRNPMPTPRNSMPPHYEGGILDFG